MATAPISTRKSATIVVLSASRETRLRLTTALASQRWDVHEADGGAAALLLLDRLKPQATLVEGTLPDLHIDDFAEEVRASHPGVDLIALDGVMAEGSGSARSPRRGELLQVLRSVCGETSAVGPRVVPELPKPFPAVAPQPETRLRVPGLIGDSARMLEVSRRIRLVARRRTTVLIQGPTGSGKEVVARSLHELSDRAQAPFIALNCAAIPEALLEAELFGHARGAFTGAVQRRLGRIEAAQGGTLFLDEIGEMPLSLQSKLLRFLESGELQRVGENETVKVDVRVIAATHQPLARRSQEGSFRADLFYRLSVFRIETPALAEHKDDLRDLAAHFLGISCRGEARKQLSAAAMDRLVEHSWPGNVRELQHVIERAVILAEDRLVIAPEEIEFDLA